MRQHRGEKGVEPCTIVLGFNDYAMTLHVNATLSRARPSSVRFGRGSRGATS